MTLPISNIEQDMETVVPVGIAKYIYEKMTTRAIRFTRMAEAAMHMKHVPAFMRSAYNESEPRSKRVLNKLGYYRVFGSKAS